MKKKTTKKKDARSSKRAIKRSSQGSVSKETKVKNSSTGEERTVSSTSYRTQAVEDLPEHVGRIRLDGGITKNLGDFESARIGISVELPCDPSDDGFREAYSRASDLIEELMEEEYGKVIGD